MVFGSHMLMSWPAISPWIALACTKLASAISLWQCKLEQDLATHIELKQQLTTQMAMERQAAIEAFAQQVADQAKLDQDVAAQVEHASTGKISGESSQLLNTPSNLSSPENSVRQRFSFGAKLRSTFSRSSKESRGRDVQSVASSHTWASWDSSSEEPMSHRHHAENAGQLQEPMALISGKHKQPVSQESSVTKKAFNRELELREVNLRKAAETPIDFCRSILSRLKELETTLLASAINCASVAHFLATKRTWQGSVDLRSLLQNAGRFSATDPRDLVYAFIGLAEPVYAIKADYNMAATLSRVLVKATEQYITVNNSLEVLQFSVLRGRQDHGLSSPSWAPDWTCDTFFDPQYRIMQKLVSGDCLPFPDRQNGTPVARVWQDNTSNRARLEVRGFCFGKLTAVSRDTYDWSRYFQIDASPLLRVQTTSHALVGDASWVLDGASAFYVLRKIREHYSLVHAAGLYTDEGEDIAKQSRELHSLAISELGRGERTAQTIYLI